MQNTPLKLVIDHDKAGITPFEFEDRLMKRYDKNLFLSDRNGNRGSLDYFKYAVAAAQLLHELTRKEKGSIQ